MMKIIVGLLIVLLIIIPPLALGSVTLPTDLDGLLSFLLGIVYWWLVNLSVFLRILSSVIG